MSADGEPSSSADFDQGLSESVVASNTVQEIGGSLYVPIPRDSARDLGIEDGDSVLFLGERGDQSLDVGSPDRIYDD